MHTHILAKMAVTGMIMYGGIYEHPPRFILAPRAFRSYAHPKMSGFCDVIPNPDSDAVLTAKLINSAFNLLGNHGGTVCIGDWKPPITLTEPTNIPANAGIKR